MPMRAVAGRSVRLLVLLALALPGCFPQSLRSEADLAQPYGSDFFDFPEKYSGRRVRLVNLTLARADITRPIVFVAEHAPNAELVVGDGRSLVSKQGLRAGDQVVVHIECTEGRTERGNLLLSVERWPSR